MDTSISTYTLILAAAAALTVEAEYLPRDPGAGLPDEMALVLAINGVSVDFYATDDARPALDAAGVPEGVSLEDIASAWLDARYAARA